MRPTIQIAILLTSLFVLNTGYLPVTSSQNNYTYIGNSPEELTTQDDSRAIVLKNVVYGESTKQVFDIYLPSGRNPRFTNVLLLLHGGGWIRGDKASLESMVDKLLEKYPDHAIVNMNYTLANNNQTAFPQQFLDIQAVIDHLTNLNQLYAINPEFGIIGRSAGAHLSLVYDNEFDIKDQVKFVASLAGPTNLTDHRFTSSPDFDVLRKILVDSNTYNHDSALKTLSPLFQVSAYSSPVLLLYGQDDKRVPLSNAREYAQKLDELGIVNSLRVYKGGHIVGWKPADWSDAYDQLTLFIDSYLP